MVVEVVVVKSGVRDRCGLTDPTGFDRPWKYGNRTLWEGYGDSGDGESDPIHEEDTRQYHETRMVGRNIIRDYTNKMGCLNPRGTSDPVWWSE